jgi:hypothetical protein
MKNLKLIISNKANWKPSVNQLDDETVCWNKKDGIMYGLKTNGTTKEVVKIGYAGQGADGDDAYVYIAYASDANGTGFTMVFNNLLNYIAVKSTTEPIAAPAASDFAGLWKYYGGQGNLTHYCYMAWRDAPGDGFTLDPNNSLSYEAILFTHTKLDEPKEADFDGLWRFRREVNLIEDISFEFRDLADGNFTYILDLKASYQYLIVSGTFVVDSGTLSAVDIRINNTAVTGLTGVGVSTTRQEYTATDANEVREADIVTLVVTGTKAAGTTTLVGKLKLQRM